jgi:hypothetical protein
VVTAVQVQVPWEFRAPSGEVLIEVETPRAPFEYASRFPTESMRERIRPFAMRSARFLLLDPPQHFPPIQNPSPYTLSIPVDLAALLALHEDEVTFVDADHPARNGEVIHAYMTGLGTVDQEVRDGELPPGDPPARIVQPISCDGTETLEAKLAPGLIGVYRVSLRLQTSSPQGFRHIILFCDGMIANRAALPLLREE